VGENCPVWSADSAAGSQWRISTAPAWACPSAFALLRRLPSHLYIAWIPPFGGGGGQLRPARRIRGSCSNRPRAAAGLPSASRATTTTRLAIAELVPIEQKPGSGVEPFIPYPSGFVDGLKEQLAEIQNA